MKTYTKFLLYGFVKSFFNVFLIMISLVFILNILKEIEFFTDKDVSSLYPIYLSLMNSPSIVFEMFLSSFSINSTEFIVIVFLSLKVSL